MIKIFTPKTIASSLLLVSMLLISIVSYTNQSGAPGQYSSAPTDGNCTSCHSGAAISSGTAWNNLSLTGLPANGYTPGTTYTLTLNGASTASTSKNGFELCVLNSSNTSVGTLTAGSSSTTVFYSPRTYLTHTSSGAFNNSFTFTWTAPTVGAGTVTFYTSYNATNSDGNTTGDAIYTKSFTLNQVQNLPTAVITPNKTSLCLGDTLYLSGSGINSPTGFTWTFQGNVPSGSTLQNPFVVYTTAGVKGIQLVTSNANGNSTPTNITVTINAKPTATISPAGSVSICTDSVLLSANTGAGLTYVWSPGNATTSSIKVGSTGNYTVTVTNSNGCSATSAAVAVTKRTPPTVTLTNLGNDTLCLNDSLKLSASGTFASYLFYRDTSLIQTAANSKYASVATLSGLYSVVANDGFCSSLPSSKNIVVRQPLPAPVISCGTKTTTSIQFVWSALAGATTYQVSTDTGKTWITANGTNQLSHTLSGLVGPQLKAIWVRGKDNGPCLNGTVASFTCSNVACPSQSLSITANSKECLKGDTGSTSITVAKLLPTGKYSVAFNDSLRVNAGTAARVKISNGNNVVRIRMIDSSNLDCPIDTTIAIAGVWAPKGNVAFNYGGVSSTLCSYNAAPVLITNKLPLTDSIVFASFNLTTLAETILKGSTTDTTYTMPLSTLTAGDNVIRIRQKNNNSGCFAVSQIAHFNKVPKLGAAFTYTSPTGNASIKFTDSTQSANNWRKWTFGDGNSLIDSINKTVTHVYPTTGTYNASLVARDLNFCYDTSSTRIVTVAAGLNQINGLTSMSVYPNPAKDVLNLNLETDRVLNLELQVRDLQGRIVRTPEPMQVNGAANKSLDLNGLSQGVYLLEIINGSNRKTVRFEVSGE